MRYKRVGQKGWAKGVRQKGFDKRGWTKGV